MCARMETEELGTFDFVTLPVFRRNFIHLAFFDRVKKFQVEFRKRLIDPRINKLETNLIENRFSFNPSESESFGSEKKILGDLFVGYIKSISP